MREAFCNVSCKVGCACACACEVTYIANRRNVVLIVVVAPGILVRLVVLPIVQTLAIAEVVAELVVQWPQIIEAASKICNNLVIQYAPRRQLARCSYTAVGCRIQLYTIYRVSLSVSPAH